MKKKQKLNIFLIKEEYAKNKKDYKELLKGDYEEIKKKGNYTLYFRTNPLSKPDWINFFKDTLKID